MFEQYKLNKYQKYIDGFAYEIIRNPIWYNIQTYLILKKDEKYVFVKYRKYKKLLESELKNMLYMLDSNGYDSIETVLTNEKNNRNEKKKIYQKSKFKVIK